VRDELAAFIVHKKNGWGVQKEQVRCACCLPHATCDSRRQVWFANGNISGQFTKMPAFEGLSSPALAPLHKSTSCALHSASVQMTMTMTMMRAMMISQKCYGLVCSFNACPTSVNMLLSHAWAVTTALPISTSMPGD
jgi:hypothetical protein